MLVTVESFGSIWSRRLRRDSAGSRQARAAYYNTTGIGVNGKLRHSSELFGQLRFNDGGGFNPHVIERNIGSVFHCVGDLETNHPKLVFQRRSDRADIPDYFLFVLSSDRTGGRLPIGWYAWKSDGVLLISLSEYRQQQELMLLMPAGSWVRGSLGWHVAEPLPDKPWRAFLRLVGC
jgi:hypothetical protein